MYCMATLTKNEICAREWKGKRKMHCAHSVCNIQRSWKVRKKLFRKNIYCVYLKWTTVQNENDGETRTRMERATKQKKKKPYINLVYFSFLRVKMKNCRKKAHRMNARRKKQVLTWVNFVPLRFSSFFALLFQSQQIFPTLHFPSVFIMLLVYT